MSSIDGIDVVFVAGPPGAGKTTVTEEYEKSNPAAVQFGTGDLMRGIREGCIDSKYSTILREASERRLPVPSDIFSMVVREQIIRTADTAETVMVTGFPYGHSDWKFFKDTISDEGIKPIGAVVLNIGMDISVTRMNERDIKKGADVKVVYSSKEHLAYEERYQMLIGRLAIRLDCYRQLGLSIMPVFAERPLVEVCADFNKAIDTLKEKKKYNE